MGDKTGISWTDATWNPVPGCSRVSEGCRHCYAEVQAARIVRMARGKPSRYDGLVRVTAGGEARWTGKVVLDPQALALPLSWRKPRRIFVNSMGDLFHESLTNEQIAAVFGVMAACPRHTFQCLTKRARRMREWFEWVEAQCAGHPLFATDNEWDVVISNATREFGGDDDEPRAWSRYLQENDQREDDCFEPWPLPNVWLGVSVENQAAADERIPELLRTPAAVRFLSCEPLIGPVHIGDRDNSWLSCRGCEEWDEQSHCCESYYVNGSHFRGIDWVIAGCESGPGARPCSVEWLRSLRDQCEAAGVPFFLKQALSWNRNMTDEHRHAVDAGPGSKCKPGGVIELPCLDGVQHAAFPEVQR